MVVVIIIGFGMMLEKVFIGVGGVLELLGKEDVEIFLRERR